MEEAELGMSRGQWAREYDIQVSWNYLGIPDMFRNPTSI